MKRKTVYLNGTPTGSASTWHDVAALIGRILHRNVTLRKIFSNGSEGQDPRDGKHHLINRAAEEMMGYGRSAVVGRTIYDLLPKAEDDEIDAHDREALSSVRPHETTEITLAAGNRGARVLRRTSVPVRDDRGQAR